MIVIIRIINILTKSNSVIHHQSLYLNKLIISAVLTAAFTPLLTDPVHFTLITNYLHMHAEKKQETHKSLRFHCF
jgi:preprotein translocase subunit SecB